MKSTLGFLPLFKGPAYGIGFLTAGVVLAIMVIPFIISVSREVLLSVPRDQREAALALGATRWESTWKVVVPFARTGILGSIFLALARALGETMAVTMVIGNVAKVSSSLFAPGYSIAAVIANEFADATSELVRAMGFDVRAVKAGTQDDAATSRQRAVDADAEPVHVEQRQAQQQRVLSAPAPRMADGTGACQQVPVGQQRSFRRPGRA